MTDKKNITEQPFLIHTFWSIGMADPFPDESTMFEENTNKFIGPDPFTHDHLVYPKQRYQPDQSPMIMYLPGRYILIKIIRACMGCYKPEDLWFNQ